MRSRDPVGSLDPRLPLRLQRLQQRAGHQPDEIDAVNRAHELRVQLYAGYFKADGKPFVCHTVGVASIMDHLGFPPPVVAAGLLHNVSGNADFGDGRRGRATGRRLVSRAMGEEIETVIWRFGEYRVTPASIEGFCASAGRLDSTGRTLLIMDLADHLEKVAELGVLYIARPSRSTGLLLERKQQVVAIASALNQPLLAEALAEAIDRLAAEQSKAERPCPSDRRQRLALVVSKSCRRRLYPQLMARLQSFAPVPRLKAGLRIITRFFGFASRAGGRYRAPLPGSAPGNP